MYSLAVRLFTLAPKNALSFATGLAARLKLPKPLADLSCRGFAAVFRLDMAEASAPLSDYATIEDLFTRSLKPGLRPISSPICSPADGFLARSGPIQAGEAIQAKGLPYSAADLVFGATGPETGGTQDFAWYQTIYLAPHNYHRVHAPFSGRVTKVTHFPGELWPVNGPFVARVPRLFSRNERLVFSFDLSLGGKAYVVMVGAFNVGRMVTPLAPDVVTNNGRRQGNEQPSFTTFEPARDVAIGDEIGTFMLGSTVVIVYDHAAISGINLLRAQDNRPILMGQTLCTRQS
ncbi:MAG: archaetidylserine decarboxylase [Proteobacteria bacterium]|nr:archaetidylserine decarboxylase [Pseudomonadota bacterium]